MTPSIEQSYCHTITYLFRFQSISNKMFWLCQRLVNYVVLMGILYMKYVVFDGVIICELCCINGRIISIITIYTHIYMNIP